VSDHRPSSAEQPADSTQSLRGLQHGPVLHGMGELTLTMLPRACYADEPEMSCRPCVDRGLITGSFCDGIDGNCFAALRCPNEKWVAGQGTPFCYPFWLKSIEHLKTRGISNPAALHSTSCEVSLRSSIVICPCLPTSR
jgi:hypothetical protein